MRAISLYHFWFGAATALLLAASVSCGGSLGPGLATIENQIDTVTLFALRGTSINLPSAYDLINRSTFRTDRGQAFDFAFDIDGSAPLIYPAGALGLSKEPGVALVDVGFDELTEAPEEGYEADSAVAIDVATVFAARSRTTTCTFLGSVARFGKFEVLAVDREQRSVTLKILVNANCGFRSLEPGIPSS